jgi:hypothetical protein
MQATVNVPIGPGLHLGELGLLPGGGSVYTGFDLWLGKKLRGAIIAFANNPFLSMVSNSPQIPLLQRGTFQGIRLSSPFGKGELGGILVF